MSDVKMKTNPTLIIGAAFIGVFLGLWLLFSSLKRTANQEPQQVFSEVPVTRDTVQLELQKLEGFNTLQGDEITDVLLIDHAGTENPEDKIVYITYFPKSQSNNELIIRQSARTAVEVMRKLFQNPQVGRVQVTTEGSFSNAYGDSKNLLMVRIGIDRSTAEKIEWENFTNLVEADPKKLFRVADQKDFHPTIAEALNEM